MVVFILSEPLSALTLADKAFEVAKITKAVEGKVQNRGVMVDIINQRAGMTKPKSALTQGWQWCMSFIYYCYDEASRKLKVRNPLMKTPSCSRQLKFAKLVGSGLKVINMRSIGASKIEIKQGDIGIHKSGTMRETDIGNSWNGHTFICFKKLPNGKVSTREGNTNSAGSREGNSTAWKERSIDYFLAIIRV